MDVRSNHPQLIFNPLLLLGIAIILTALLGWLWPLPFFAKAPSRFIGGALFVGGLLFGLPAFRGMRRAGTSPDPRRPSTALVEEGTYRLTRNPMYVGMLIAYAGLFIFLRSPWFVVFLPLLIWMLTRWVILPEESYLQQRFGEEYLSFKARVRRWI
jgi:protein-S-isoprenylcysteine O-methyltransferase Ste14